MIIGVPKEIKKEEYRVAILPSTTKKLVERGHQILIEKRSGVGAGIKDEDYQREGAEILATGEEVFKKADLIVKVKEPQEAEYPFLREGQIVFTFFHFASSHQLTEAMIKRKIIAFAYEVVEEDDGSLPILTPMSEVAGKLAPQEGAKYLEKPSGGKGVLLGGIPGVAPAVVLIIGAGIVGENAAIVSAGMGAEVLLLDINVNRLRYLKKILPANVKLIYSNRNNLEKYLKRADLVIGAVLIPGAKAPKLISREMLKLMERGTVLVDVSIDQGGCFETSHPTTHKNPTYSVGGIIHYCVANIPGAVARTSTFALTNATEPYLLLLAGKGAKVVEENIPLRKSLSLFKGKVTSKETAETFNLKYTPIEKLTFEVKKAS